MIIGAYVLSTYNPLRLWQQIFSVDMLAHAVDNPAPSTIVLISGDRDFAYALSILRLRRYRIVLITLSNAHPSLRAQASLCFNWTSDVLGTVDPTPVSHQPTSPRRGKTSITPPTHDRSHSDIKGFNLSRSPFQAHKYFQDKAKHGDICLTPPKRDFRPDFFPPESEPSKKQPAASMPSTNLRNGPESPARAIHSPVASSCHAHLNNNIKTPLIMTGTSHDLSSLQTLPSFGGNTPKLAPHESTGFRAHISPRRSTSLPNIVLGHEVASVTESVPYKSAMHTQILPDEAGFSTSLPNRALKNEVASVAEPVSFKSAMQTQILPAEADLRGFSPSPQQQSAYSTKSYSLSNVNQTYDPDGNSNSSPAHMIVHLPTNVTTTLPTFAPSLTPLSSLNHHTTIPPTAAAAQSSVKTTNPAQPPPPPAVPYKFEILVQCLKSHRSKGNLRPLRGDVAQEIARNGATYRQAGVLKFRQYAAIAEREGIVELGGWEGTAWIALTEPWIWCSSLVYIPWHCGNGIQVQRRRLHATLFFQFLSAADLYLSSTFLRGLLLWFIL